jgi:acylphosphatase
MSDSEEQEKSMIVRHYLISGLVQGVFFRAYTEKEGLFFVVVGKCFFCLL